jgi:hypothetical protein
MRAHEKTKGNIKSYLGDCIVLFIYHFIVRFFIETNNFGETKNKIAKIKFSKIKNLLQNKLFSIRERNKIFGVFSKAQKYYSVLSKFAYICKLKMAQFKVKTDLLLNDIDTKKDNVFIVYQNKAKYAFVINDLNNMITISLSNCPYWFAEPLEIKNPYNNLPFNKTTLYNLYFYIRRNLFTMPMLFELFFNCNFDLPQFKLNNENYIREVNIKNYAYRSHYSTLHLYVLDMFHDYRDYTENINIHKHFPKKVLVDKMRPYLYYYFMSKYLIFGSEKRYHVEDTLSKKLFKLSRCSPNFGKRTIKFNKQNLRTIEYNTDCISFFDEDPNVLFVNWNEFDARIFDDFISNDSDDF